MVDSPLIDTPVESHPRVVIIGGGFAGLEAARALRKSPVRVTLVDRRNHHLFQPLLYQVATAGLAAPDIAAPIRKILKRQANVTVLLREITRIDAVRKRVVYHDGHLDYDYLIVAAGAVTTWFGHPEWAPHAPGLKSLDDALAIRQRMLAAYEEAELATDEETRKRLLTFVVVGGGATGVELAGALNEISRRTLKQNFRRFDPSDAKVMLVEGSGSLLNAFPPKLQQDAKNRLERTGVKVLLNTMVTDLDADGVSLKPASAAGTDATVRIASSTVIWAAGVKGAGIGEALGHLDRGGHVRVTATLAVPDQPDIYVVGDLAHAEEDGKRVPGIAPAAIQMGRHAAKNIRSRITGGQDEVFHYFDKGMLATIGRAAAVGQVGRFKFTGFFAWLVWLFVHILYLATFRNRVVVLFQWALAYFTWNRPSRILFEQMAPRAPPPKPAGAPEAAPVSKPASG